MILLDTNVVSEVLRIAPEPAHRVLPFDAAAAFIYGDVMARRKRMGRPLSVLDGQIVSIAKAHRMMVATRNTVDFEDTGVELVNPWERR